MLGIFDKTFRPFLKQVFSSKDNKFSSDNLEVVDQRG
jgi:hypothetical protein